MRPSKWLVDRKQNGKEVHSCLAVCICSEINDIDLWLAFCSDSLTSETLMLIWVSHCFTKQTLDITNRTIALWLEGVRLWFRFLASMPDAEPKVHYSWPTIFDPGPAIIQQYLCISHLQAWLLVDIDTRCIVSLQRCLASKPSAKASMTLVQHYTSIEWMFHVPRRMITLLRSRQADRERAKLLTVPNKASDT